MNTRLEIRRVRIGHEVDLPSLERKGSAGRRNQRA
jgi:hypothetical protein